MLLCFFFNDPATTEIYTLSLHDALPILRALRDVGAHAARVVVVVVRDDDVLDRLAGEHLAGLVDGRLGPAPARVGRSEEHTSELQSRQYLVCRLLLEKKKTRNQTADTTP